MIAVSRIEPSRAGATVRGENSMQNLVANTALQASQISHRYLPSYAKIRSIWHHMSDALAPVALPRAHAADCRAAGNSCVFCRAGDLRTVPAWRSPGSCGAASHGRNSICASLARADTDWTPATSPTEIVARVSFWACVLLGLSSAFRPSTPPTQQARPSPFLCFPISRTRWARHSCWLRVF